MQNCPLLEIDKKEAIQISWKGNEECFLKNRKNLDLALGGGSLSWKRDNQKGSYPLHVRYKPKFVPFGETLICNDIRTRTNEAAFLHIFFVFPLNIEDYRYNIRPVVSEWFARLNEAEDEQWIIVFDSSKIKEKKIRNAVYEKLRSDFAKFLSRLIEISDTANATEKNAFFSLVQFALTTSFNVFVDHLQSSIQKLIDGGANNENEVPNLPLILNLKHQLCQFYWNLSLIENALHELDDLEKLLTSTILNFSSHFAQSQLPQSQNKRLNEARMPPFGSSCTYLGVLMRRNCVDERESMTSLAELRAFVLAHQILLTFHMFYQRYVAMLRGYGGRGGGGAGGSGVSLLFGENLVESSEVLTAEDAHAISEEGEDLIATTTEEDLLESTKEMAFQLCQNFVSFILRYTYDALTHLMDDLNLLKANCNPAFLHITVLVWHAEVFTCCKALGNILKMESAFYFICQITFLQCDALLKLLAIFSEVGAKSEDFMAARRWFEESAVDEGNEPSTSASKNLFSALFAANLTKDAGECNGAVAKHFQDALKERLIAAVDVFRNFNFFRHVEAFNLKLLPLMRGTDMRSTFDCIAENFKISLNGNFLRSSASYASQIVNEFKDFAQSQHQLFFNCYFILSLEDSGYFREFFELIRSSNQKRTKSNIHWDLLAKFPWRIKSVSDNFIRCDLHGKIQLKVALEGRFLQSVLANESNNSAEYLLKDISIKLGFKPLLVDVLRSNQPLFNCEAALDQSISRFACCSLDIQTLSDKTNSLSNIGKIPQDELVAHLTESQIIYLIAVSVKRLSNEVVEFEFFEEANVAGCFALDHLLISLHNNLLFYLNYQTEISRNPTLDNVLCFVNTKKPQISILNTQNAQNYLLAGVAQNLCLELNVGTVPTKMETQMEVTFVCTKPLMHFLSSNKKEWTKKTTYTIPEMRSEQVLWQNVIFYLVIDRMNFSADQSHLLRYDLRVDWLKKTWYFPLNFLPIINIKSMTSQLSNRVLFEVDIQRCDAFDALKILPNGAILLQDQSIAKEPIEAVLLNPKPFQPIVANSSYRFVWQLPNSQISKSIPVTHFIKLSYLVQIDTSNNGAFKNLNFHAFMPAKEIVERNYLFEDKLTFAVQKVEYEVCAHVLSDRPQSVLCRVGLQCDLIVSLRSLFLSMSESVIVVVEVDPQFWMTVDKFKIVHIKGSGIGQTTFAIIPKRTGYLPYPSIFVHRYLNAEQNDRHSFNETTFIGERLNSFHRNHGKQIHVLGHLHNSEETSSIGSFTTVNSYGAKKSLKSQAKDKIQRLFELKD